VNNASPSSSGAPPVTSWVPRTRHRLWKTSPCRPTDLLGIDAHEITLLDRAKARISAGGHRGSNPRPSDPKSDALSTALYPLWGEVVLVRVSVL
jgi:hypothetical protein